MSNKKFSWENQEPSHLRASWTKTSYYLVSNVIYIWNFDVYISLSFKIFYLVFKPYKILKAKHSDCHSKKLQAANQADNFSTRSHISLRGETMADRGENSIGIVVFEAGENLKWVKRLMRPILDCIKPNLKPMQFLGPSPNGRWAIGCRFFLFSSVNRSGSNLFGSGKYSGSFCIP